MGIKYLICLLTVVCMQVATVYGFVNAKKKDGHFGSYRNDVIIKHDGTELDVKVRLVTTGYTFYTLSDEKKGEEQVCCNEDIYMIKFKERGNVFFSETGDVFFGSTDGVISDNAVLLYLVRGEEIAAYDVVRDGQYFRYYTSEKKVVFKTISADEVFMIKYINRPNEVVTPLRRKVAAIETPDISIPEDEFVELIEAKPASEYIIKNRKKNIIRALVIYGNDEFVSYYRKESPNGPLYRMARSEIFSITSVSSKKRY